MFVLFLKKKFISEKSSLWKSPNFSIVILMSFLVVKFIVFLQYRFFLFWISNDPYIPAIEQTLSKLGRLLCVLQQKFDSSN